MKRCADIRKPEENATSGKYQFIILQILGKPFLKPPQSIYPFLMEKSGSSFGLFIVFFLLDRLFALM